MRYKINFDRLVNQFVPHYLGGRKLVLYLQSVVSPLQSLNSAFSDWAKEIRIEASMTSQIFKLEWFLNRKFSKYFKNPDERIVIANAIRQGLPLYYQHASIPLTDNPALYAQGKSDNNPALHRMTEKLDESSYSFNVNSPAIQTSKITTEEYLANLQYWIDKYRLAGKTYKITINQ